ncbi:MAG: Crp/Fnr family transcriptional regulator [Vicinamibacterales bacterium]
MAEPDRQLDARAARVTSRIPFLADLPRDERRRLGSRVHVRRLERAAVLWHEGAPTGEFMFVVAGRVKLVTFGADGRESIVDLRGPGQLLCSGAACVKAPYCCSAVVQTDGARVAVLSRQDVLEAVGRHPTAVQALLREVTTCSMNLCRRIGELSGGLLERRLAMLLLRLATQLGQPRDGGAIWIPVALSRQDLADLCGTTFESAIRTMSRFARERVVETHGGGFLVLDRQRLEVLAAPATSTPDGR